MSQKRKKKSILKSMSNVILDYLREDALVSKPLEQNVMRFVNTRKHSTRKPKKVRK